MGLFVCGSVTTITRNCVIDPRQPGCVGAGSDRLQLIKFWPSRALGRGSAAGRKFLGPPYYSQRAVFASLLALFSLNICNSDIDILNAWKSSSFVVGKLCDKNIDGLAC